MRGVLTAILVVVAATLLALGATELALRLLGRPPAPPVGWKWDESPYRNQPDTATNQLGLRGRPIQYGPNDFVVVLLGDSQVEAGTRLPERMPERVLEQVLREQHGIPNARVFTVAGAGWGTDQEYVNLQAYFRQYRADLVLLWFTAVNDYWENGNIDRSVQLAAGRFKPTFELGSDGQAREHAVVPSTKVQLLLEQSLARLQRLDYPQWRLQRWLKQLPEPSASQPGAAPGCPATTVEQARMWGYEGDAPITVTTDEDIEHNRSHFSPFGATPSPREKYQVSVTQALLEKTAALAQANGAKFRFFYPRRPDLDVILSLVKCARSTTTGATLAIDGTDLVRPLDTPPLQPYRIVFALPPGRDVAAGRDDIHHNDKGNQLALQGLAAVLAGQGLLPSRK